MNVVESACTWLNNGLDWSMCAVLTVSGPHPSVNISSPRAIFASRPRPRAIFPIVHSGTCIR